MTPATIALLAFVGVLLVVAAIEWFERREDRRDGEDGTGRGTPLAASPDGAAVRRLMPIETERLQGWPDDWTRWRADGREIPDGTRYRLVGNGVVAPVAAWIGRRLRAVMEGRQP